MLKAAQQRLPDFLIIGAQRSGTTTVFRDLHSHPDVFLPEFKEPNVLCSDDVLTQKGRRAYATLFRGARPGQICGEASTAYTKWPDYLGIPERARTVLGEDLKLIYITRDPIARIKSQYALEFGAGRISTDIDEAIRELPRLINYSRYAAQIRQWLEYFPPENIRLVQLEQYSADHNHGLRQLLSFLGLSAPRLSFEAARRHNARESRLYVSPTLRKMLYEYPVYRRYIQPFVPWNIRRRVSALFVPRAKEASTRLSPDTIARIQAALSEDVAEYKELWDAQRTRDAVLSGQGATPAPILSSESGANAPERVNFFGLRQDGENSDE